MVSLNGINGANQYQQINQVSAIKPETQKELQALGISTKNIKTETQAQEIIKEFKELQQVQNQIQAQGAQPVQNVQDMSATQQVNKPEESQQVQAFAGGQAGAIQGQQPQPFQMLNDIIAQQNRLKLGLI